MNELANRSVTPYLACHDAAVCSNVDNSPYEIRIGQLPGYRVERGAYVFDTSYLSGLGGIKILSARLKVYKELGPYNMTGEYIVVVDGSAIEDTPVAADFGDLLTATTELGSVLATEVATGAYTDIELNAAGLALISKTGNTKFGLRSTKDINSTMPTSTQIIYFWGYGAGGAKYTKLEVTWVALAAARWNFATWG